MQKQDFSRRDFLKVSMLSLGALAFTPVFPFYTEQDQGLMARITVKQIDLRSKPNDTAPIIGKRYRDQIVHIYEELHPEDAPKYYNTLWYRVWGGYIHSAHTQIVKIKLNAPGSSVPESGKLCEITVPYTVAYQQDKKGNWSPWDGSRMYYETTHWATGIQAGPDGEPWYRLTSEIDDYLHYYVPARHIRLIPDEEVAPISPDIPPEKKRVVINLSEQKVICFEYDKVVYTAQISSGIPNKNLPKEEIPTDTPKGNFYIYSKMPSKHMGSVTGNPDASAGFSLPGVPWTSFFVPKIGVAFHGTYWHNNFGLQMSHGCVNMRNPDARWLFRWSNPVFDVTKIEAHTDWEKTGYGTPVEVF